MERSGLEERQDAKRRDEVFQNIHRRAVIGVTEKVIGIAWD